MLPLKPKLKPIESRLNTKLTKREEKKPLKLNKLLKMQPTLPLKKLLMRPRKQEKLKKINKLLIWQKKWRRESLNSKKSTNMFG